ncbi:hypothetical protein R5R35_002149 [Gryllus longicercus]|uniref:C-type lectin domain-containing protein n=1 Tax=Gryllus longicercus TaxID=2509291 RepID=A0AAN9VHN7_9ORTH
MASRLLALLLVSLATWTPLATQPECASGEDVDVAVSASANATGHRRVRALLEQPQGAGGWQLRLQAGTTARGDGPHRQWLLLTLDGPPTRSPTSARTPSPRPPAGGLPTPSPVYLSLPGLGRYRQPPQAKDWFSARRLCHAEGARLWVPTSRREVARVFELFFPPNAAGAALLDRMWVGAGDLEQEGRFVTDDGEPIEDAGIAEFPPRQPDGKTAENCLGVYKSGLLIDYSCNQPLTFICKVPL